MKLLLTNKQCPGDVVTVVYAHYCIKMQHPDWLIDYAGNSRSLFEAQDLDTFDANEPDVTQIDCTYSNIQKSNHYNVNFIDGVLTDIEKHLNVKIKRQPWRGFLRLRDEEKSWLSAPREILGEDRPYWIVNAGYKNDYTAKAWPYDYYQEVVDALPEVTFVQIGHTAHQHPTLTGDNLLSLVGQTDDRQLVRLIYNSFGVLTPVSAPMMLSTAITAHPRFKLHDRALIVLAGGREPMHWHIQPAAQYLHTIGMYDCCSGGACWKSRVIKLGDGDRKDNELCVYPTKVGENWVGRCMAEIKPYEAICRIQKYMKTQNLT